MTIWEIEKLPAPPYAHLRFYPICPGAKLKAKREKKNTHALFCEENAFLRWDSAEVHGALHDIRSVYICTDVFIALWAP